MEKIHIISGGTFSYVRSHFALAAPAFGAIGTHIGDACSKTFKDMETVIHLTGMAGGSSIHVNNEGEYEEANSLVTNEDVEKLVDEIIADKETKIVFFPVAMCDFKGKIGDIESGKYANRLSSGETHTMQIIPNNKVIHKIREKRKDIFLIGFKQTTGKTKDEQYKAGLNLLKSNSCNLVLANDVETRWNMIIVPEEARYPMPNGGTQDRVEAIKELISITQARQGLTYVRSNVVQSDLIPWESEEVPEALRKVVNHCIEQGAYKPFREKTSGHFAYKPDSKTMISSIRKTNYNNLKFVVKVVSNEENVNEVTAFGAKPSAGSQTQRIMFEEHKGYDCVVHMHCPMKKDHPDDITVKSQREMECGSRQCAINTSEGLKQFGNLKAVYLDEHGPNIIFNKENDPQEVIDFIDRNFDLKDKTGGLL